MTTTKNGPNILICKQEQFYTKLHSLTENRNIKHINIENIYRCLFLGRQKWVSFRSVPFEFCLFEAVIMVFQP